MKSYTQYLWFDTKNHREYINITPDVEDMVGESKVSEGFCLVSAMHITASVYVNGTDDGLIEDIDEMLEDLAPSDKDTEAHLKRMLLGHQVVLPITKGKLDLGPGENVFYAEFDGQRKKRVVVKIIGE